MNFWINFWKYLLFGGLGLFAILAVLVAIGGFFDVLSLFKSLKSQMDQEDESTHKEDG